MHRSLPINAMHGPKEFRSSALVRSIRFLNPRLSANHSNCWDNGRAVTHSTWAGTARRRSGVRGISTRTKVFLYAEHYRSQAEPAIHAASIRGRGAWIPGVIDPAARGRSQVDGTRLIEQYSDLGLLLAPAENAVEAGLSAVWERLSDGRLFVFNSLQNWLSEFRIYRRDERGKIVKQSDHLMDATRYLILSGLQVACREPREEESDNHQWIDSTRNEYTGY